MIKLAMLSATVFGFIILAPFAEGAPLPEGHKPELSKSSQECLSWYKENLLGAYKRMGQKDKKWDSFVKTVLSAAADHLAQKPGRSRYEIADIAKGYKAAAALGCQDPLPAYLCGVTADYKVLPPTLAAFKTSKYHAALRCDALVAILQVESNLPKPDREKAKALLDEAVALLPEVFSDRQLPVHVAQRLVRKLGTSWKFFGNDRKVVWEKTLAALGKERADSPFALTLEGDFWLAYAWDGRSSGFAAKVTEEQWKLFRERLDKAGEVLDKAWKKEPHLYVALSMMTLALGQGAPRAEMEKWFERAVREAPDDYRPYEFKLNYLEPKWHGSPEEMLEFGKEVLRADHWAGHYRILADTHWVLSTYPQINRGPNPEYFQTPGVWDDVKTVYDRFLKSYPKALRDRSRFVQMAVWSGQWEEADRQFRLLRPAPTFEFVGRDKGYREMRELVNQKVKEKRTP